MPKGVKAPAAWLACRVQFREGHPDHVICKATKRNGEPCNKIALRGCPVCGNHGGFGILANRGLYTARWRRGLALPPGAEPEPVAPAALRALPVWRLPMTAKDRRALARVYGERATAPEAWRAIVRRLSDESGGTR